MDISMDIHIRGKPGVWSKSVNKYAINLANNVCLGLTHERTNILGT